ncbi:hypothetical protein Phpb_04518 [Photorhabdus namnaonensis]|uniref:Uncharacterized protein n=1 Tax=Photorhabdus namnaonensis TaxID=1851568 RepID=A0A1B8YB75_9GAMM|nr:hypothetical protein Phpb_04518 [Photorhabdus namnaonensis]
MFRIYKQNLELKNHDKSQIRIKGIFRKETICSNIFIAYIIFMTVFKFNNPLFIPYGFQDVSRRQGSESPGA